MSTLCTIDAIDGSVKTIVESYLTVRNRSCYVRGDRLREDRYVWVGFRPHSRFSYFRMGADMSKKYARNGGNGDPKGDRRSRTISSQDAQRKPVTLEPGDVTHFTQDALHCLAELLSRGDGWVRMTSTLDMKTLYLKYKYNSGPWRGLYVMSVATFEQMAWGICLLHEKVLQVDRHERRPSVDTFYKWDA